VVALWLLLALGEVELEAAPVSWLAVPLVVVPVAPVVAVPAVALPGAAPVFDEVLASGVHASESSTTSLTWNEPSLAWLPFSCTCRPSFGFNVASSPVTGVL
jgi:hypothetical protein